MPGHLLSWHPQPGNVLEHQRLERNARSTPGVGLGLHIASQLAQAMEGSLTAESEYGKGTTFTLTLPAVTSLSIVG